MIIKVLMLLLFFTIMVGIGFYCRQTATDVNGFVLGGRSVGPWLTAFAYGTSYFSAVIFVGYAGQFGWKYGIAATWVGIGNALIGSLMAWRILGRRTRIMTQHLDTATMPEFYSICVVVMAVLTGIYVIVGGYMATAINDFIQGIIMLFGITAVILAVLNTNGGLIAAMDGLAKVTDETVSTTPGVFNSFLGPDPFNLLGVVILTSLGTWGLPQMVQKFYAIKNEKSIETGTVISTFFAIVVAGGCYFLGGFGRLFSDKIDIAANGFDSVIPTMLSGLPDILIGVVVRGEEAAPDHALADRALHPDLRHHRADPVQVQRDLHRAADGYFLGRYGRSISRSFPVRPVLEEDDDLRLLGELHLLRRLHVCQYAGPFGSS